LGGLALTKCRHELCSMHGAMLAYATIDEIYEQFTRALRPSERSTARGLAHAIGMAPSADVPWSRVFFSDVLRALPVFLAEAMPGAGDDLVHDAVTAHALGIIAAFAVDHLQDGQVTHPTPTLFKVVNELRRARDAALERLGPGPCDPLFDYGIGEWELAAVAAAEQRLLREDGPADVTSYERIAVCKQHAAFPAAMRLALAAGCSADQLELVRSSIRGIAMAFQMGDDVSDWQDDLARGGAWPVALVRPAEGGPTDTDDLHRWVLDSGILGRLLERAASTLGEAGRAAGTLGATRLARWAEAETQTILAHSSLERESPGTAVRLQAERRRAQGVVANNPCESSQAGQRA
jgi:hypothetical protein